ncbi:hypothetical protein ABB02_00373 [Clostridiaceae bacterium JG1575]|nr:hypothetical protein ABB02_00373 [Clostridiaceae bacterium JG1575]
MGAICNVVNTLAGYSAYFCYLVVSYFFLRDIGRLYLVISFVFSPHILYTLVIK